MTDQGNAAGFRIPSSGLTGLLGGSVEEQLSRATERLRFYESFDRLIQDNITRSGDLLREAADLRERAQGEIAHAQADLDRNAAAREERHRLLLAALLDELAQMRRQNDRLYERIADALAESEAQRPPSASLGDIGATLGAVRADVAPQVDRGAPLPEPAPGETVATPESRAVDDLFAAPFAAGAPVDTGDDVERVPAWRSLLDDDPEATATPATPDDHPTPVVLAPPDAPDLAQAGARPVMVLVHGVPRAAAALSLQRHLAGLEHVEAVEAREYAEGVLRLQVMASRPLLLDDLRSWDGGADLESIHVQADVVEVKLPGAETL